MDVVSEKSDCKQSWEEHQSHNCMADKPEQCKGISYLRGQTQNKIEQQMAAAG